MNIKSVGWFIEEGEIVDERNGSLVGFDIDVYWDEGEVVSFEEGLKKMKEYMYEYDGKKEWKIVEKMLIEMNKNKNNKNDWVLWSIERDCSLGYKVD